MKTKSFHNTINLEGKDLSKATKKAISQEQIVLSLFIEHDKLTSSQVLNLYPEPAPMLNSIRRAISNLKHDDKIVMTNETILGNWGKPNHVYQLKSA